MIIHMNYGKSGLDVNLHDSWDVTVIRKKKMPILSDPVSALQNSMQNPVGSPPFNELIKGKKTVCIAICDITRPVPNSIILPTLMENILKAGIDKNSITILVATGLHSPTEGEALEEVIGNKEILNSIKIYNHYARNEKDHIFLGKTQNNVPVKIDRRFIQADLRLVVGLVEPHFMAGYSGGRKLIAPGIAHEDTIRSIHAPILLEKPGVDNCIIDNNPLHHTLVEIAYMVGECYGVNTVIDEERRISFVNFGEIVKSHFEAVAYARPFVEVEVEKRYPVIITSAAGYPLDKNYYQTVKGMIAPLGIIEPGGQLFIVSQCSEGIGSPDFCLSQQKLHKMGIDGFKNAIHGKTYAQIDEWETEMLVKAMKVCHISLYSTGITEKDRLLTGIRVIDDIDKELKDCLYRLQDKRIAVIPEGPYVIPIYKGSLHRADNC